MSGSEAEGIGGKNDNGNSTGGIDDFWSDSNNYRVFCKRTSVIVP